jgi:putative aldouronate transport system permease protein
MTKDKHQNNFMRMGYGQLYILMIPGLIYYVLFRYVPIYGIIIGFKEFNFMKGIWDSPWIGLENFRYMFQAPSFKQVFSNTLVLGFLKLIVGFPLPILFAVLLNEVYQAKFKKLVQTISYLPHFLSWVVLGGIFFQFFSINGPINVLIEALGLKPISFLTDPGWFRFVLVSTHVWKVMGWNSIVFLAAIAGINPEMYEAAMIDGAGRVQRIIHITIPSLAPVITVMFILAAGQIINDDFDQIFNLYNPAVYRTADVISTYVYRQGLEQLNFSYATAVELFKNLIALALVWSTNRVSKKINEYGIW